MRRRALFLAMFATVGVLMMTACTSSDREIAQDAASGTAGSAGTTAPENTGDAGTQEQGQDPSGQDPDADGGAQEQPDAAEPTGSPSQEETKMPESDQTEATADESEGDAVVQDIWSGTYASGQETVTIALVDAKTLSFSFANSGIASTAEVDGATAIYRGDDHHVVVFEMNEGVLNVTVSSEEDFDASGSPLNGVYVRQTVSSDTE